MSICIGMDMGTCKGTYIGKGTDTSNRYGYGYGYGYWFLLGMSSYIGRLLICAANIQCTYIAS